MLASLLGIVEHATTTIVVWWLQCGVCGHCSKCIKMMFLRHTDPVFFQTKSLCHCCWLLAVTPKSVKRCYTMNILFAKFCSDTFGKDYLLCAHINFCTKTREQLSYYGGARKQHKVYTCKFIMFACVCSLLGRSVHNVVVYCYVLSTLERIVRNK